MLTDFQKQCIWEACEEMMGDPVIMSEVMEEMMEEGLLSMEGRTVFSTVEYEAICSVRYGTRKHQRDCYTCEATLGAPHLDGCRWVGEVGHETHLKKGPNVPLPIHIEEAVRQSALKLDQNPDLMIRAMRQCVYEGLIEILGEGFDFLPQPGSRERCISLYFQFFNESDASSEA